MSQPTSRPVPVEPPAVTITDQPHDAILLLSFGGPNLPEDVVPFLKNVTRGRGIPEERLVEVGQHYYGFGGKSPINELNLALQDALEIEFGRQGINLPVYWGNRNWNPYLIDVMREIHNAGHRKILVITTSAYSGYSSCCQYNADLEGVLDVLAGEGLSFEIDRLRHLFNIPSFVKANATAVVEAIESLSPAPSASKSGLKILFVTHSIPLTMNDNSGRQGGAYEREHRAVAATVAAIAGQALQRPLDFELTYCSRSGPPTQPWLEPDVGDRIEELSAEGITHLVVAPIGFISDHMEVVYDLDTEAKQVADEHKITFARAATVGTNPEFIAGIVAAARERIEPLDTSIAGHMTCGTDMNISSPCWPRSQCCNRAIPASAPRTSESAHKGA